MAEARNSFIKSKMNKDLDARLIPSGEYRDAQNVSVSKSEGADVGSLENILGNISLTDFGFTSFSQQSIDIIGFFMDVNSDRIFLFMTNFVDTSSDRLSNFATSNAECHIAVYNTQTNVSTVLVSGNFLNFSKTNPVLGVNLIQNTLFFTDNRNQPRKINVSRALGSPSNGVTGALSGSLTSSITTNATGITNGTYTATVGTTSGVTSSLLGSDTQLSITVNTGVVDVVDVTSGGKNFVSGETITITSSLLTGASTSVIITITTANLQSVYYTNEDQISLAKYYPYEPISLIETQAVGISAFAAGNSFPAGTRITNMPTTGGTGTGLTVDVYVGGGNPGPVVSINQTVAGSGYTPGQVLSATGGSGTGLKLLINSGIGSATVSEMGSAYNNGDTVSATARAVSITASYTVATAASGTIGAVTINSPGEGYTNGDVLNLAPTGTGSAATVTLSVESTSTMKDVVSENLPDNASPNPFYNANWPGDKEFLKERFIRFAYRFKFDDGEYSLISPFTQECFVPEQDGYFVEDDEDKTYKSTEVDFMKNKINDIRLVFNKPAESLNWGSAVTDLKIDSIDIIYKDSSSTLLKLLDTINSSDFSSSTLSKFTYDYQSSKPYKTLPVRDLLRVYDQTPVRALSQETIGNRLVFGNFVDKHTPPETLNYNMEVGFKVESSGSSTGIEYSEVRKEYQNHTLKQDRNYQVGVVLSDKYGRQSDVILSSIVTNSQSSSLKGSTIFNPYKSGTADSIPDVDTTDNFSYFDTSLNTGTYPSGLENNLLNSTDTWPGDQLKIKFLTAISSTFNSSTGTPGLYSSTNTTGWYSYKVVVKQDQTDYYNVYCPGILNGYIDGETDNPLAASAQEPIFHFALHSDNLSKIPKDISIVGPNQNVFRTARPSFSEDPDYYNFTDTSGNLFQVDPYTEEGEALLKTRDRERDLDSGSQVENASIKLSTRVLNYYNSTSTEARTRQYYPGRKTEIVTAIGTGDDLGLFAVGNVTEFPFNTAPVFYNFQSNPFIARMSVYSVTSSVGIGEFGQPGPSPNAGEYKVQASDVAAQVAVGPPKINTNYPGTGGSGVPVVFEDTIPAAAGTQTGDVNLFKNKGIKIAFRVTSNGIAVSPVGITITNPGDGWETIGLTAASPSKSAFATVAAAGDGNAYFKVTVTKSTYGPAAGLLPIFSVFETKPLESKLDIYWETSTAGKISELNTNIVNNDNITPYGFADSGGNGAITSNSLSWSFPESNALNTNLTTSTFFVTDYSGTPITTSTVPVSGFTPAAYNPVVTLVSVTDSTADTPNNVTSDFEIISSSLGDTSLAYRIQNTVYKFFGNNSTTNDVYNFVLQVVAPSSTYALDGTSTTTNLTFQMSPGSASYVAPNFPLSNVTPSITLESLGTNVTGTEACGSTNLALSIGSSNETIADYSFSNGTNTLNTAGKFSDCTFLVIASTPVNESGGTVADYLTLTNTDSGTALRLTIDASIMSLGLVFPFSFSFTVRVTDAGGLRAQCVNTIAINNI
jgi:hypothetical protein